MSNFNQHKIYRVIQMTDVGGHAKYQVEAADSWIAGFFGMWTEYTKDNENLGEAVDQIQSLASYRLKQTKIVYKEHVKNIHL